MLTNLSRRGLVRRVRDARDARCTRAEITIQGRKLMQRVTPLHARQMAEVFSVLKDSDQTRLTELCARLGRAAAVANRCD